MKSFDYDCVTIEGLVYCVDCLPEDVDVEDEGVTPVFADTEVEEPLVCAMCDATHDYMNVMGTEEDDDADR